MRALNLSKNRTNGIQILADHLEKPNKAFLTSNFQQIFYSCPFKNCSEWHNTYQGTSDLLNYFRIFLKITHCYLFYMENNCLYKNHQTEVACNYKYWVFAPGTKIISLKRMQREFNFKIFFKWTCITLMLSECFILFKK